MEFFHMAVPVILNYIAKDCEICKSQIWAQLALN